MSAMKNALIATCEALEADGVATFDELMSRALDTVPTGYVCKRCGFPSPVGVGYADAPPTDYTAAQLAVTSCPCGYSVRATSPGRATVREVRPDDLISFGFNGVELWSRVTGIRHRGRGRYLMHLDGQAQAFKLDGGREVDILPRGAR